MNGTMSVSTGAVLAWIQLSTCSALKGYGPVIIKAIDKRSRSGGSLKSISTFSVDSKLGSLASCISNSLKPSRHGFQRPFHHYSSCRPRRSWGNVTKIWNLLFIAFDFVECQTQLIYGSLKRLQRCSIRLKSDD